MLRTIVLAAVFAAAATLSGCANGWPHVHHEKSSEAANCGQTGTRIPRSGCANVPPAQSMSGEDIDRGMGYPVPNTITPIPTRGPH
ncbi:MAG TPA: hypothetical protein VLX90_09810 [Steroidobacteraceae bacterium]|nr:hypothetical protein [Steroidobacteraceae bacterium]